MPNCIRYLYFGTDIMCKVFECNISYTCKNYINNSEKVHIHFKLLVNKFIDHLEETKVQN
jgi:hypothetical protein